MHLAFAVARGRRHISGDALVHVEAVLRAGAHRRRKGDELRDGGHAAIGHTDEDAAQGFRIQPVAGQGVGQDAVHLAKLVVVAHEGLAAVVAQRRKYLLHGNAGPGALDGIHGDIVFGEGLRIGGFCAAHFRTLLELGKEHRHLIVEVCHVAVRLVLNHEFYLAAGTKAGNLRHGERNYLRFFYVLAVHVESGGHQVYVMVYARALFPVLEPHEEGAVAGTGAGDEAVAGNAAIGFHFRNGANLGLYLLHNLIGLIQGGTRRRAHLHHEYALIFIGHQTAGHHLHEVDHAAGGNHQENPGPRRCAHKLLHAAEILA